MKNDQCNAIYKKHQGKDLSERIVNGVKLTFKSDNFRFTSKMRTNKLKQVIKDRNYASNAWLSIPSSCGAEVVAHCGFDAVPGNDAAILKNGCLQQLSHLAGTPASSQSGGY